MVKLREIWIEDFDLGSKAIRVDWSNDRHQLIEIEGDTPEDILRTFEVSAELIRSEINNGNI